jgi:hypothetical protein
MTDPTRYHDIPSTQWSIVVRAAHVDPVVRQQAIAEWLARYLPALRTHLVLVKRIPGSAADDLLQAFIADKILDQEILGYASRQRGKFRNFIFAAVDRFVVDDDRYQRARKRAPEGTEMLDEGLPDTAAPSPSRASDIAWGRQVIEQVVEGMKKECAEQNRPDIWRMFQLRLLGPFYEGTQPPAYQELVAEFGFRSPAQASNVLITAKRMFIRLLRARIAEYEPNAEAVEEEIRSLRKILSESRA